MKRACPYCIIASAHCAHIVKSGHFRRYHDGVLVQRYRCLCCRKYFCDSTGHWEYRQRRRELHTPLLRFFASGQTQRRLSYNLSVNRKTIVRKFRLLGKMALLHLQSSQLELPKSYAVQFDDMESVEHTKCKPVSITVVVESGTRRILGFATARMPAKGRLAKVSRIKYGPRQDERGARRQELFNSLKALIAENAQFESDQNPHYTPALKKAFPRSTHIRYRSRRACVIGQGELKKGGYDPLFWLNHTCAQIRADVSRLFRRSWNLSKKRSELHLHVAIQAVFHNHRVVGLPLWPQKICN